MTVTKKKKKVYKITNLLHQYPLFERIDV